jgi:hypothetical protein
MTLHASFCKPAASTSIMIMPMDMAGVLPDRTWTAVEEGC